VEVWQPGDHQSTSEQSLVFREIVSPISRIGVKIWEYDLFLERT
jgi:hypothetical protein